MSVLVPRPGEAGDRGGVALAPTRSVPTSHSARVRRGFCACDGLAWRMQVKARFAELRGAGRAGMHLNAPSRLEDGSQLVDDWKAKAHNQYYVK